MGRRNVGHDIFTIFFGKWKFIIVLVVLATYGNFLLL